MKIVLVLLVAFALPCACVDGADLFDAFLRFAEVEDKQKLVYPKKVAVGVNANLDLIVSATDLFGGHDAFGAEAKDFVTIEKEEDFLSAFTYFFEQGKAAERFVTNTTFFSALVRQADQAKGRYAVGGNAALMSQKIVEQTKGTTSVMLGGIVREKLKSLLPLEVDVIGPHEIRDDQIHLIIEYKAGDVIFGKKANRANRFIVSSDFPNAQQAASTPFFVRIRSFSPNLVIWSGLHLLDGVATRPERRKILRSVRDSVADLRSRSKTKFPIHFEWASIGNKQLVEDILFFVPPLCDSMGFNEEEAWSLFSLLRNKSEISFGSEISRFSHSPHPRDVEVALSVFAEHMPSVSRFHFHSLGLHMTLTRLSSDLWRNNFDAIAVGSLGTSLAVCGQKNLREKSVLSEMFHLISDYSSMENLSGERLVFDPVAKWRKGNFEFHAIPVLVCKDPKHTVGAGDSISSGALLRSLAVAESAQAEL